MMKTLLRLYINNIYIMYVCIGKSLKYVKKQMFL